MNYLHIMPPSKRMMIGYLTMLQQDFDMKNHKVIFESEVGVADSELLLFSNTVNFPSLGKGKLKKYLTLKNEFNKADRIIFHCFKPNWQWLTFLYIHPQFLDKAVWIMWGIDLYNYKRPGRSLKNRILNHMEETCKKRMRYPVVISEVDIAVYEKEIGTYPVLCAPYGFMNERFRQMDALMKEKEDDGKIRVELDEAQPDDEDNEEIDKNEAALETEGEPEKPKVRIQIGHNAFPFNNHFQVLTVLGRFQDGVHDDDFELILPVAYGNQILSGKITYLTALKNYALARFPGQVTFWTKMVNNRAYTKRLASIDVAIFNSTRQNGFGNLLQLLYMGKKVYLSSQNPLFPFLRKKGFEIHDVNELKTIDYEEFILPVQVPCPNPWVKSCQSVSGSSKIWSVIFRYVEGNISYEEAYAENMKLL